jgi:hypothetical protein
MKNKAMIIVPMAPIFVNVQKLKLKTIYWNLGAFLMLLESPWQVEFNRISFTVFRAKL